MTRDYKPRAQGRAAAERRKKFDRQPPSVGLWKWMLITAIIISFVVFLVYFAKYRFQTNKSQQISQTIPNKSGAKSAAISEEEKKPEIKSGPKPPQFDFYTILPEKE